MKFKGFLIISLLSVLSLKGEAQTSYGQVADTFNMATYNATRIQGTNYCWGWIHYPSDYFTNPSKKYPVIFFGHGAGQTGNGLAGLSALITSQDAYVPYIINAGDSMNFYNQLAGDTDRFIIVSCQASTSSAWSIFSYQYDSICGDLIWHKCAGRIDTNRIYGTGLSAGGEELYDWAAHWNSVSNSGYTPRYKLAAILIQSAVINTNGQEAANFVLMATDSIYIGGMGDSLQDLHGIQTAAIIDSFHLSHALGSAVAYLANTYYYYHGTIGGGHCCWYNQGIPSFSWTWHYRGVAYSGNIYQFLAMHSRAGIVPGDIVTVNAGSPQTLTAGTTSALLSGSATTSNPPIERYQWSQISGPAVTMLHPFSDTTTILGLSNGNTYGFQLWANNIDSVNGTNTTTVTVSNPSGSRMYINPQGVFYNGDTSFLQQNPVSRDSVMYKLFDEQHSVDPMNTPSEVPVTYPAVAVNPQEFYPLQSIVDFGAFYKLTDLYFYDMFGSDSIYLYSGSYNNWTLYYAGVTGSYNVWTHLNSVQPTTRYFRIVLKSSQSVIGEVCFYGIQQTTPLPTTPQVSHFFGFHTADSTMGINSDGTGYIWASLLDSLGMNNRWFENFPWMDSNSIGKTFANLKYNFDIYSGDTSNLTVYFPTPTRVLTHHFPSNTLMQSFADFTAIGHQLFFTINGDPTFLSNFNSVNGYYPIDSFLVSGYRDSSITLNYQHQAQALYWLGAVGGAGGVSTSTQVVYPPSFNQGVMGLVDAANEKDADGVTPFWQIPATAAYLNALNDGGGSAPSSHLGIKNAYSAMQLMTFGSYYPDTVIWKGIKYWLYNARADHRFPLDYFNFHWYLFSSPNHSSGSTSYGMAPELMNFRATLASIVNTCHILSPQAKVAYTEWGYDRNRNSPLHVKVMPGVDSATHQAWLITRSWLGILASGVDFSTMFQFQMDPQSNPTYPHVNPYDTNALYLFNSTGLVTFFQDPTTFAIQYIAYPAYYYVRSLNNLLHNYRFDSLVSESTTSYWEYRFRNTNTTDSLCLVVWSPTDTNTVLNSQLVSVGKPNNSVNVVQFTNGSYTGTVTPMTTDNNGFLTLTISENPTFIMTITPSPANNCNCIISNKQNKKFVENQ